MNILALIVIAVLVIGVLVAVAVIGFVVLPVARTPMRHPRSGLRLSATGGFSFRSRRGTTIDGVVNV